MGARRRVRVSSMLTRPMDRLWARAPRSWPSYYALVVRGRRRRRRRRVRRRRPGAAVSTFVPAKIDVAKVQRSCASRTDGGEPCSSPAARASSGSTPLSPSRIAAWGVLGLDNVNDYYPTSLKRARMKELEKAGVHTVEADLNDKHAVREALDACKFTHVLHLAAQAGVRYAVKNPGSYVHSNVAGMVNIMEEIVHGRRPCPRLCSRPLPACTAQH